MTNIIRDKFTQDESKKKINKSNQGWGQWIIF